MQRLELAVAGLEQALCGPERAPRTWRQVVQQRVASVGDALSAEVVVEECAVAARAGRLRHERRRLLDRLGTLGTRLTSVETGAEDDTDDTEHLRRHLLRLSHDISHHHRRVLDLAYDTDGRDVGGSE